MSLLEKVAVGVIVLSEATVKVNELVDMTGLGFSLCISGCSSR
jgi:hypothetical protein